MHILIQPPSSYKSSLSYKTSDGAETHDSSTHATHIVTLDGLVTSWLASLSRGPEARICTISHMRTRMLYLTWDASPCSWCISSYSQHPHTRHQTVLRLTIQVHMQHILLKYWLLEALYSKVQVHSWSYIRHSEYALYACMRTQLASPAQSAMTIILRRLCISPAEPISRISGRQTIYTTHIPAHWRRDNPWSRRPNKSEHPNINQPFSNISTLSILLQFNSPMVGNFMTTYGPWDW